MSSISTTAGYKLSSLLVLQGQSLERIGELFQRPWLERTDVMFYLRLVISHELITVATWQLTILVW